MINIRPVSDLRNKFPEIEETVLRTGEPVYLTKNGYGSDGGHEYRAVFGADG